MIIIFTMSEGRSGTKYLSDLFKNNVKNCIALHEPSPDMFGRPIYWFNNGNYKKIRTLFLWKKKKISQYNRDVYIEANHAFLKSFSDVAMEFFPDMKLIHLVRNPQKVAKSEVNRSQFIKNHRYLVNSYIAPNFKLYFRWALTGREDIFQAFKSYPLTTYQRYVVQWIEVENRAMRFLEKYKKHNDCFTLNIPKDLNDATVLKKMFDFFGLNQITSEIVIRGRKNKNTIPTIVTDEDKQQFQEVINQTPDSYLEIFHKKPYIDFDWINALHKQ